MQKAALMLLIPVLLLLFTFPPEGAAEPLTVTVERGDTLYSIGREYGVSVDTLVENNGILNPRQLKRGMEITVPHTHVVERGDTLYSLARSNGTTVEELCRINDISPENLLKVGSVLRLPGNGESEGEAGARLAESGEEQSASSQSSGETAEAAEQTQSEAKQVREERKKQEAQSTKVREASYEKGEKPRWPHGGERAELTGKLEGTQISGAKGDEIVAVASGRVVWVAPYRGYGKLVMIESANGMIYAYGGNEEIYVDVGDRVEAGRVIGSLGINPVEKNAKAFFFVYKNGKPIDPEKAPRG